MPRSSSSAGIFPVREQSEQEATLAGAEDYEGSHIFYADGLLDEEVGEEHLATNQVNFSGGDLKDFLRCSGCHRFLFPPILQCTSGHMHCKNCSEVKASTCGKCQAKLLQVPAKFAEMVTEQFKVQCSYFEKGCKESVTFKARRDHEEVCPFKPVQCPEFDCCVRLPIGEIFRHFRTEHNSHFVNAHGPVFNGDIRCDDSNMVMGVERKWAPTMMKLEQTQGLLSPAGIDTSSSQTTPSLPNGNSGPWLGSEPNPDHKPAGNGKIPQGTQHFFLEILRTKHGVWHMWIWYLGEPEDASHFRCEISIRRGRFSSRQESDDSELKYSGRVHSIRIPPHRVILSGCLLSFSDYTAGHFRYLSSDQSHHPVIDYRVCVSRLSPRKQLSNNERVMAAGLSKMFRRFSVGAGEIASNK